MKRILAALVLAAALSLGIRAALGALRSPEDRVRARIAQMVEGFNSGDLSDCMIGLAPGFQLRDGTVGREWIKDGLIVLFLEAKDRSTKAFRFRVEVPEDLLEVELLGERAERGHAKLTARFYESNEGVEHVAWELRVEGALAESNRGWQFVDADYETLQGGQLSW